MKSKKRNYRYEENKEENVKYIWNEEIGNYCLAKRGRYNKWVPVEPIKEMKLSEMKLSNEDLYEMVQNILYQRTGEIDEQLGFTGREYAIKLAKEMKVW